MHTYIYIYTYINEYIYMHIYLHRNTYTHVYTDIHINVYVHKKMAIQVLSFCTYTFLNTLFLHVLIVYRLTVSYNQKLI